MPISPSFVKRLLGTNALDEVCLSCGQALLLLKLQQDWLWRQSSRMLPTVSTHRSGAPFASSKSICVQACSLQASPSVSKSATETVMEAEVRAQILTGGRGDQPRKSGCCQGHREQLCEWQSRSAHKCEGGGWRMTQGLVVENEREYFVGRQKLCYLLWTWSCRCRCHMY